MQTARVDLSKIDSTYIFNVMQEDTDRQIRIELFDDGELYEVSGDTVSVWYEGSSGDAGNFSEGIVKEANALVITLDEHMTKNPGKYTLAVMLTRVGGNISTWNMVVNVSPLPGRSRSAAEEYFGAFSLTSLASDLNALNTRVDNIIANAGDTGNNAELVDIRLGYDGTTYPTAGEAVRSQIRMTETRLPFFAQANPGKNLFNKESPAIVDGVFLNESGKQTTNRYSSIYFVSDFIPAKDNTAYTLSPNININVCICFYGEKLNFLSSVRYDIHNGSSNIQSPSGTKYIRFTGYIKDKSNTMLEEGSVATEYEDYVPLKQLNDKDVSYLAQKIDKLEDDVSPITKNITRNLIDYDSITYNIENDNEYTGCFINKNGDIVANTVSYWFCVSDYINIDTSGITYSDGKGTGVKNAYAALYDINKKVIKESIIRMDTSPLFIPYVKGAVYARLTLEVDQLTNGQHNPCVVAGNSKLNIKPGDFIFSDSIKEHFVGFKLLSMVPPERLVIQKGKETVLYKRNMFKNSDDLPIFTHVSVFNNLGDFAYLTQNSTVPSSNIDYQAEDCLGRSAAYTGNYVVLDKPIKDSLNILCIGDSFTDIGTYVGTIKNDIEEDGITVNQIGNMGRDDTRHEARSGGTWDFVTTKQGRAIIVDVQGISSKPQTGYPGTTYQDQNGFKWTVRGFNIDNVGNGKLILGTFKADANYGDAENGMSTDADDAANSIPDSGILTKTSNDSIGGDPTASGDTTINYSGVEKIYYNPFWNPSTDQLDFEYYINKWGYNSPDVVVFSIGYNDVGQSVYQTVESLSGIIEKAKIAVDKMHSNYPDTKIVLNVNPLGYGGVTANKIASNIRVNNQITYYEALIDEFGESTEYSSYVTVCPSFVFVDRIDAYSTSDVSVGRRIIKNIKSASDGTHCNADGMKQIGDAITAYIYYALSI